MKKIFAFILFGMLFFACEKDNLLPDSEIPLWLKEKITEAERLLENNPDGSYYNVSAWIRYKYGSSYYFEFDNLLSSANREVYDINGSLFNYSQQVFFLYQIEKCCPQYVWKGKSYFYD